MGSSESRLRPTFPDYVGSTSYIGTAFKRKSDEQFQPLIRELVGKFGYDVVHWHGDDDYIEVRNKQTNEVFDFGLRELIQLARYKQAIDQLENNGFNLIRFYDESYTLRILKAFAELPDSDPTRLIILSKLNSVLDRKHMLVSMSGENREGPIFVDVLGKKHTSREVARLIQLAMLNQGYRLVEQKDDVRKEFVQLYRRLQKIYLQSQPRGEEDHEHEGDKHLLSQLTRDVLSELFTLSQTGVVPPIGEEPGIELADRRGLDHFKEHIDTAVDRVVRLIDGHGRSATRNPATLKTVIISLLVQAERDLSERIASSPEALRYLNTQLMRKGLDLRIVPEDIPATTSV